MLELSRHLKLALIKEFHASSDESSALLSASIIGRDLIYRRIDQVLDVDTVIVVTDPMDENKLAKIERIFIKLRNQETNNIGITYAMAEGPIKPLPQKRVNIFFHVLLHTISSYKNSPLILVKNSWQYESHHLVGAKLSDIQIIPEPALTEIVNGALGIMHCKELVEEKKSSYFSWDTNSNNCQLVTKEVKFNEGCEILEICFYSILRAASNALRYILGHTWGIGINAEDMLVFQDVFSELKASNIPFSVVQKKGVLRQGAWYPTNQDVMDWLDISLSFLEELGGCLPKKERLGSVYTKQDVG